MSFLKEVEDIQMYLLSIHNFDGKYYSVDIKSPKNWLMPDTLSGDNKITKFELDSASSGLIGIRFTVDLSEDTIESLFDKVKLYVRYNEEREKKDILFENTVRALKNIFDKTDLNKLKTLKFYFSNGKKQGIDREKLGEIRNSNGEEQNGFGDGEETVRSEIDGVE